MSMVIPDLKNAPPSPLSGRDCLTLGEFTPEEMSLILDEAVRIKALQKSRIPYRPLRGRTLAQLLLGHEQPDLIDKGRRRAQRRRCRAHARQGLAREGP